MKKKCIIIAVIIGLVLLIAYCCDWLYKPSRLICVGQINEDAQVGYIREFKVINREDLESYLKRESESESPYFVLNQQEIDELVEAANQYENYPTVIFSKINSKVFFTRLRSPHVGYMNVHQLIGDGKLTCDDVIYVYVTKCDEIDEMPIEWLW